MTRTLLPLAAALTLLVASPAAAQFEPIQLCVDVLRDQRTNALVLGEEFDIWTVSASNPNAQDVTSLSLEFTGQDFLGTGGVLFKNGAENPIVFGFEAPDAFFVVPDGFDPPLILAVDSEDSSTRLAASYTIAGGGALIPAGGALTPIATISVPSGTPFSLADNFASGNSAIGGQFVDFFALPDHEGCIPEPTAAATGLLALAIAGSTLLRRSTTFRNDLGSNR